MYLGANGLVINELGHVLLIQRDDSRSWGLPGGGLDQGETPTEAVTREVEEETGLKTLPVRLVGLYFRQEKEADRLMFLFRCLVRGGTVTPSPESPQVGYIKYEALPSRILAIHRQQIDQGYLHAGGPPVLQRQTLPWLVGRLRDGCQAAVAALAGDGALRSHWTPETATDALWALLQVLIRKVGLSDPIETTGLWTAALSVLVFAAIAPLSKGFRMWCAAPAAFASVNC